MKVKELIKELEGCDPESTLSCDGKALWFIEEKQPYWDGFAADEYNKDKMVYNGNNNKVDIHIWEPEYFIEYTTNYDVEQDFDEWFAKHIDISQITVHSQESYKQYWQREFEKYWRSLEAYHDKYGLCQTYPICGMDFIE